MMLEQLIFWLVAITGAILAAWWLTVRPSDQQSPRNPSSTIFILVISMACLLALLALSYMSNDSGTAVFVRAY